MITVLAFIFVLGLLVFVHELGHFAVAKWSGIRVETFSLGFPPKMIGFRKGDTEYCISWIPLGGYVKMSGEKPDDEDIEGKPWEFMSKPVWKRALVIFAGPAMNYILAIAILFGIYYFQGEPVAVEDKAAIGEVVADHPAGKAGLMSGDVVVAIDDEPIGTFEDLYTKVNGAPGETLNFTWLRGSDTLSAALAVSTDTVMNMQGDPEVVGRIGVGRLIEYRDMSFGEAVVGGFDMANFYVVMIFKFLKNVITGEASSKLIGGPIFIAQAAGEAAKQGFVSVLILAAILSVNLCVVNLAPIPVLDGGQLLFLGIEKLKGSPVSLRGRAIAQQIGLVFLILLIIFVTSNDIMRINLFGW